MSWADILYPGNEEKKKKMVQDLQEMEDSMRLNFKASNKLATYLNKEIPDANLPLIYVDKSKSLKENADFLLNQIKLIDVQVEKVSKELKEKLDPGLYEKLTNVDTSFKERFTISQDVLHVVAGITGVTVSAVVGKLVAKRLIKVIASRVGRIAASALAGAIAGGIAGLAVDVIVGAITGAVERSKLKSALGDLEDMVKDFIPASDDYTETIFEVMAEVKIWDKFNPPQN